MLVPESVHLVHMSISGVAQPLYGAGPVEIGFTVVHFRVVCVGIDEPERLANPAITVSFIGVQDGLFDLSGYPIFTAGGDTGRRCIKHHDVDCGAVISGTGIKSDSFFFRVKVCFFRRNGYGVQLRRKAGLIYFDDGMPFVVDTAYFIKRIRHGDAALNQPFPHNQHDLAVGHPIDVADPGEKFRNGGLDPVQHSR